jgi:DNA-binding transcriptional ArsR family regulator
MITRMVTIEHNAGLINGAELAVVLKAMGDETRLNLLIKISQEESADGACICDLTPDTNLAQSTVSHHMKILVEAGLLSRTQKGKWAHFSLTPTAERLMTAFRSESLTKDSCC